MIGDLYGAVLRNVLFPGWEGRVRHRPILDRLAWLERMQWRPREEIEAVQVGALRQLLRHAYQHVPLYRRSMDAAGVQPKDVKDLRDLVRLPTLRRQDARAAGEAWTSTAPPLPAIRKATSGSTGEPLIFGYEPDSEHWRQAIKLRGYGWAGYRIGASSLHYWGAQATAPASMLQRSKIKLDHLLKRETYVNCMVRGEAELQAAVDEIKRVKPQVLLCYTQAGADLARFINDRALRDWDTIPVICGAERLFSVDREALQQAFGPAVFETYGCREMMLIAAECELHDGLHISAENLVVEVMVDGRAAQPGEIGEVVITDLHNLGMPFIRYVTGDLAMAGPAASCECGRALPRISSVEGRVAETLRDAEGGRVSGLVFNVLFAGMIAASVRHFQAVQHQDGSITLKLVPARPLSDGEQELLRATCSKYLKGVAVRTEIVAEIPLTAAGKRQVVLVEGHSPPSKSPESKGA